MIAIILMIIKDIIKARLKRGGNILKSTILLLGLTGSTLLNAQDPKNPSIVNPGDDAKDVTEKGLKIGMKVPSIAISSIHNYKRKNTDIQEFRGKLLILDFWATWCSPCVASFPKLQSLQKEFKDDLQIISVTNEKEEKVFKFMDKLEEKYKGAIPIVTDDRILSGFFPHVYLPHYVWIDPQGELIAITSGEEVSRENIERIIKGGKRVHLKRKQDYRVPYEMSEPVFNAGNGGEPTKILFRSILTPYKRGLSSMFSRKELKDSTLIRLTFLNYTIPKLFSFAYGGFDGPYFPKQYRFEVRDTSDLMTTGDPMEWHESHTYCYELILPKSLEPEKYNIMKSDLDRMFPQYRVEEAKETADVLALIRTTSDSSQFISKGGKSLLLFNAMGFEIRNQSFEAMVAPLKTVYLQNYPYPIVDDTGFPGNVDLKVEGKISDIGLLNKKLKPYGLEFNEKKKEIPIIIFKDKQGGS